MNKNDALGFLKSNAGKFTLGSAVALGTAGLVAGSVIRSKRKKRKSRGKSKARKKLYSHYKKVSKRKRTRRTPYTAGKRRDTSMKRIRYTKNGQPYVIMASGKARFIKKKSAKTSRKRTGGRY